MPTSNLDFATWNFSNVQLAPIKLKLVDSGNWIALSAALTAETAQRVAADNAETAARVAADAAEAATRAAADLVLQANIDEVSERYAHSLMLGGM